MTPDDIATDDLLRRAADGDPVAREELLARFRPRLSRMVNVRMDRRLAPRVDSSDIVQEALAEADRHLDDYLRDRPLPFYPWLRRLAWERLVAAARQHIRTEKRSLVREAAWEPPLPDESEAALIDRLAGSGTSPSGRLRRKEDQDRVRTALAALDPQDREVLVLRFLEQLSTQEAATVLGITEGAIKSRLMRALVRLRTALPGPIAGGEP